MYSRKEYSSIITISLFVNGVMAIHVQRNLYVRLKSIWTFNFHLEKY